ncbi:MAG: polysaccharide deacetylase family protein [Acidothermaceae bacterium]
MRVKNLKSENAGRRIGRSAIVLVTVLGLIGLTPVAFAFVTTSAAHAQQLAADPGRHGPPGGGPGGPGGPGGHGGGSGDSSSPSASPTPKDPPPSPSPSAVPPRITGVTIAEPHANASVSGKVEILAAVSGRSFGTDVQFFVNGSQIGTAHSAPYRQEWDTTKVPDGKAVIAVRLASAHSWLPALRGASQETVIVNNKPTPTPSPTTTLPATTAPTTAPPAAIRHEPLVVTLDFDDGTADQFQTLDMLKSRGLVGTYYVNSGRVGSSSLYMTLPQVLALQAAGNEIGGHTVYHLHLAEQSPAEQARQICVDRDQLLAEGLNITDMALPFGEFNQATLAAAKACGYDSVRKSEGVSSCNDCPDGDVLPPADPYQLKALSSLGNKTLGSSVINHVQHAEQAGGLVQLVFHRVCTQEPCRANALQRSQFVQVLDWLANAQAQGALTVKTVHEAIGGPLRPPVAAPAKTSTHLVVPNASFEQGQSAPGVPVCWEDIVSGDGNQPTWSFVQDAHSGKWAQRLDLPVIGAGVALTVTQDEGTCAPSITVGDRYTIGIWYKSNAPIHLVAYRRLLEGGYRTFGLSQAFPASPGKWAYASFTTEATPPGANAAIAPGVAIRNAGTFTFDDVTLTDAGPTPAAAKGAGSNVAPSPAGLQVPVVANQAKVSKVTPASWLSRWPFAAGLAAAVVALVVIDRRLAWLRRSTWRHPAQAARRHRARARQQPGAT